MKRIDASLTRRHMLGAGMGVTVGVGLAACSSGSDPEDVSLEDSAAGSMETFAAGDQFKASEPLEVSLLWTDWPDVPIADSWEFFDTLKSLTNVDLALTNIPFSDATEKRSLLISAGDAPYVIPLVYTGEERQFAASGAVIALSDYEDKMPHFQKFVEEWDLRAMIDNLRQADGKYYMMPGLQEVSVPVFTLILRKDIFDEVGEDIPQTWDELRGALVKIKEKYPDSYPLADGFEGQSMLNYAAHAFGTVAGWGFGDGVFVNESSGEFEYAATNEGYKAMVEYFRGLVEDELLDTESFTQANDGAGTVTEKFAASSVFAASGSAGTVQEFATALKETAGDGNFELVQIAPPGGTAGQVCEPRNFWNGFMITTQATEDPNFLALLQFLDWLYYNPDSREMLRWGVKDQTYTKAEDGTITIDDGYSLDDFNINPDGEKDLKVDLGYSNNVLADATESRALKESYNAEQFVAYIDTVLSSRTPREPFPAAPLTEAELEQSSLLSTSLKDTVDTATLQFIMMQRPMSDWDAYVAELEGQGLQQYLDLINGARERFAENN